jgi:hypothetical protein
MALKTTLEMLEEVQEAITEVLTSQEMSGEHGSVVRARLSALNDREEMLLARYKAEQLASGGTFGAPASNVAIMRRG